MNERERRLDRFARISLVIILTVLALVCAFEVVAAFLVT